MIIMADGVERIDVSFSIRFIFLREGQAKIEEFSLIEEKAPGQDIQIVQRTGGESKCERSIHQKYRFKIIS